MPTKLKNPTPISNLATTKIAPDILAILKDLTYDGDKARITQQLDRDVYLKVNEVLTAMGGKWNRSAKAHVFEDDARAIMEDTVHYGEYVNAKKTFQFFETPEPTALLLVDKIVAYFRKREQDPKTLIALEPSAGRGRIAVPLRAAGFTVKTVELDPKNVKELKKLDFKDVLEADFCDNAAVDRYIGAVDAVGMNPPFNKQQDMKHVRQAFTYLKDGGILVAIMSPAWTYRSDKLSQSFRQLVKRYRGDWSELPENTFAESGTNVRTGILTIAKHE